MHAFCLALCCAKSSLTRGVRTSPAAAGSFQNCGSAVRPFAGSTRARALGPSGRVSLRGCYCYSALLPPRPLTATPHPTARCEGRGCSCPPPIQNPNSKITPAAQLPAPSLRSNPKPKLQNPKSRPARPCIAPPDHGPCRCFCPSSCLRVLVVIRPARIQNPNSKIQNRLAAPSARPLSLYHLITLSPAGPAPRPPLRVSPHPRVSASPLRPHLITFSLYHLFTRRRSGRPVPKSLP